MSTINSTELLPCPVCGTAPTVVMCHISWNVKCTKPGCLGYLHDEFLTRVDTAPEEPATAVTVRWNTWIAGLPIEASDFLKKFFALPIDQRSGPLLAIIRDKIVNLETDYPNATPEEIEAMHQQLMRQHDQLMLARAGETPA